MTKKERFKKVIAFFEENIPLPETELHYQNPYQLTVAVILSAQCTDKRVNMITPSFYRRFPDPASLAKAKADEVYELIKSCSYPNNKTRHLIGMAEKVTRDFQGQVPDDVNQLITIPGIGRKSANVITAVAYDIPAMPVDTHVFRVSERIGLSTRAKSPLETEKQLTKHVPREMLTKAHHWLILHGRYVCQARKPKCDQCRISSFCDFYQKTRKE